MTDLKSSNRLRFHREDVNCSKLRENKEKLLHAAYVSDLDLFAIKYITKEIGKS